MILIEQDRGRTIETNIGSIVTLRLKENPTTGYRWTVEAAPGLVQISDSFETGDAIGAAGMRELQFRAAQAGTHELRMKNWRKWEGESSVIDRFGIKLIVRKQ